MSAGVATRARIVLWMVKVGAGSMSASWLAGVSLPTVDTWSTVTPPKVSLVC